MTPIHGQLLRQQLERVELIDCQMRERSRATAEQMQSHQQAILRLIEVPGIGADAAQQMVAEIGPTAAAFPSSRQLASWMGVCPGSEESAAENRSDRCAKGNRFLRRVLCQAAQAAVHKKAVIYRRCFIG